MADIETALGKQIDKCFELWPITSRHLRSISRYIIDTRGNNNYEVVCNPLIPSLTICRVKESDLTDIVGEMFWSDPEVEIHIKRFSVRDVSAGTIDAADVTITSTYLNSLGWHSLEMLERDYFRVATHPISEAVRVKLDSLLRVGSELGRQYKDQPLMSFSRYAGDDIRMNIHIRKEYRDSITQEAVADNVKRLFPTYSCHAVGNGGFTLEVACYEQTPVSLGPSS